MGQRPCSSACTASQSELTSTGEGKKLTQLGAAAPGLAHNLSQASLE